jgi:peptide/nickel transport system permease protein
MVQYMLRRLAVIPPTLFLASIAIFLLLRVVPGDVAAAILGEDATAESLAMVREQLGLNRPLIVQYLDWLNGIVNLNLGDSMLFSGFTNSELIGEALPVTLHMTVYGMVITLLLAIPIGMFSAFRRNSVAEYLLRAFCIGGLSIPTFWLGIIVLYLLLRLFNWAPQFRYVSFFDDPVANFKLFVLPASIFAYNNAAILARMLRSQLLEVGHEDFVRTARAKGLSGGAVAYRHVMPNALLPVVTVLGTQFTGMLNGLVVIEQVFALPGLGTLTITAAQNREFVMVQSLFLLLALVVLSVNLLIDLLYAWLDPRIRLG